MTRRPRDPRLVLIGVLKAWSLECALLLAQGEPAGDLVDMLAECSSQAFSDVRPIDARRVGGGVC